MGRPRKDAQGAPARKRIRDAFWDVLERKPFMKMTVKDIVNEAQVNRNTFYYHFDCIETLAQTCVKEALPREISHSFIGGRRDPETIRTLFNDSNTQFRRLRLACSDQGSGVLGSLVREGMRAFWFEEFDLTDADLSSSDLIMLAFITGGIATVLGESRTLHLAADDLVAYISGPFAQTAMPAAIDALSHAARKSAQNASR